MAPEKAHLLCPETAAACAAALPRVCHVDLLAVAADVALPFPVSAVVAADVDLSHLSPPLRLEQLLLDATSARRDARDAGVALLPASCAAASPRAASR
jgi:hypothetical protein